MLSVTSCNGAGLMLMTIFAAKFPGLAGQCEDSRWTFYEGNCYFTNTQRLPYDSAKAYCAQQNAFLTDVQSPGENQFLWTTQASGLESVWIGYNDIAKEGTWVWESTGQPGTYTNWNSGEPNNSGGNEDCAELYGPWNDRSCSGGLVSVCKKSAAKNVEVNCTSTMMVFTVRKDYLGLQSGSGLSLNDPVCRPTEQTDTLYISWTLSGCGNIVTQNGNKTTYSNTLQTAPARGSVITRAATEYLTVTCTFDNQLVVSSGGLLPNYQEKTFTDEGFGQYTLRLDFTDSLYSSPITNFPVQVQLSDQIYFHLSVESRAALDIFAVRCYATPDASATSPLQYEFLKDDCPQEQTLFINSSSPESMKFGMKAFRFLGNYSSVYVHCEVIVCHTNQTSRCSQGCLTSTGRKRRQAADDPFFGGSPKHTVSQGPFLRKSRPTLRKGSENSQASSVASGASEVFLLIAMLITVILFLL